MPAFPEIPTSRLRLRRLRVADIPNIIRYVSNENITRKVNHIPYPYEEEDAVFWINLANQGFKNRDRFTFAIALKSDDAFIGAIGLTLDRDHNRAELGYWVGEPFWNRGIATEAAGGILRFGFEELRLNKIFASHFVHNTASGKVMTKNGMIREGVLADHYRKGEQYFTVAQYRLTRREYAEIQGAVAPGSATPDKEKEK